MYQDYFEFYNPAKILSGHNALENIPYELNIRGASRPLLLTSGTPAKNGLADQVLGCLRGYGIQANAVFSQIPKEPTFLTVSVAADIYRQNGCDSLIALGGGSVLDTAKGVKLLAAHDADCLDPFLGCEAIPPGIPVPLIAIPTTAGTGSECNRVAVLADGDSGVKQEFLSASLIPDVAVVDPRTTLTLPPLITASTGMDALVHAVEAYTCLQKNPISDALCLSALGLIGHFLVKAVSEGEEERYRLAMSNAALMAGMAFSNSMVGLCHAIGHACGAVAQAPHGQLVGVLLPHVMRYNMDAVRDRVEIASLYGRLLLPLAGEELYAQVPYRRRPERCIAVVEGMLELLHLKCGLPQNLRQAGVEREQFQRIAKLAENDGAILLNPKPASGQEILAILEAAY